MKQINEDLNSYTDENQFLFISYAGNDWWWWWRKFCTYKYMYKYFFEHGMHNLWDGVLQEGHKPVIKL